jgi:hypothetical protein
MRDKYVRTDFLKQHVKQDVPAWVRHPEHADMINLILCMHESFWIGYITQIRRASCWLEDCYKRYVTNLCVRYDLIS